MTNLDQLYFLAYQYLDHAAEIDEDPELRLKAENIAIELWREIDKVACSCLTAGEVRIHEEEE